VHEPQIVPLPIKKNSIGSSSSDLQVVGIWLSNNNRVLLLLSIVIVAGHPAIMNSVCMAQTFIKRYDEMLLVVLRTIRYDTSISIDPCVHRNINN
jgi:hypothetical protein